MKVKLLLLLFGATLLLPLYLSYAQRGQGVRLPNATGQLVELYDESHALVIGVSAYNNGWAALPGVKRDVAAVSAVLREHGFNVTVVNDPTRAALEKAIKDFIYTYGQRRGNRLLLYFAGHGHTLETAAGQQGYILPIEAPDPSKDLATFKRLAISMDEIDSLVRQIEAKHVLWLFDSCFSGALFEATRSGPVPPVILERTQRPVRQFITAGTAEQTVPDNSIFRAQFVAALRGEGDLDHNNYVTGEELGLFLSNSVTNYSRRAQTPQHGKIRNPNLDKGDFVFELPSKPVTPPPPPTPRPLALGSTRQNGLGMEFTYIPAGSFTMGSTEADIQRVVKANQSKDDQVTAALYKDETPSHAVTISQGFFMGRTEVTQAQWEAVMKTTVQQQRDKAGNYALSNVGPNQPMYYVSWEEAQEFIKRLNERKDGYEYRLPTEAEWEYAARAGTTSDYAGNLDALGWYGDNSGRERRDSVLEWVKSGRDGQKYVDQFLKPNGNGTHEVSTKSPNPWGLYDTHGNVWEWCADWYGDYPAGNQTDPRGPATGQDRVVRGGSWDVIGWYCRSAIRLRYAPGARNSYLGFRVVSSARTRP